MTDTASEHDEDTTEPLPAPPGLDGTGRKFWDDVTVAEFSPGELHLVERAARCLNDVVRIESALVDQPLMVEGSAGQQRAHPLLAELARFRKAFADMVRQLNLAVVDEDDASVAPTMTASQRGSHAANARFRGRQ